jgi:hypothetical protein
MTFHHLSHRAIATSMVLSGLLVQLTACKHGSEPTTERKDQNTHSAQRAPESQPASRPQPNQHHPVRVLLRLDQTAYGATLAPYLDGFILITEKGIHQLPRNAPVRHFPYPLDKGASMMGDTILYWAAGQLRTVHADTSNPRVLGPIAQRPRSIVSSSDGFAWITLESSGVSTIKTFKDGRQRIILTTSDRIEHATMIKDWVFFIATSADRSWRVGGVPLSGAAPAYNEPRFGRVPALLAPGNDSLFFYHGPERSVFRLSADLKQETVVGRGIICSPLAFDEHVFCAHVGGLYFLDEQGKARTILAQPEGPIAAVTANAGNVAWVTDTPKNRLSVSVAPIMPGTNH